LPAVLSPLSPSCAWEEDYNARKAGLETTTET
jgi:hypothetical protein